jgi:hypothetical protein
MSKEENEAYLAIIDLTAKVKYLRMCKLVALSAYRFVKDATRVVKFCDEEVWYECIKEEKSNLLTITKVRNGVRVFSSPYDEAVKMIQEAVK